MTALIRCPACNQPLARVDYPSSVELRCPTAGCHVKTWTDGHRVEMLRELRLISGAASTVASGYGSRTG